MARKLQEQTACHQREDSRSPLPGLETKHTSCRRRCSQAHAPPSGSHIPREALSLGRRRSSLLPRVSPKPERTQLILITMLWMKGCEDAGFRRVATRAAVSSLLCLPVTMAFPLRVCCRLTVRPAASLLSSLNLVFIIFETRILGNINNEAPSDSQVLWL